MAGINVKAILILSLATCLCVHVSGQGDGADASPYDTDILILGAGTAGLHAARILLEQNFTNFKILEGSNQTGGILQSVNFGGLDLPTGYNWLMNREDNAMLSTADQLGMGMHAGAWYYSGSDYVVLNDQGQDVTKATDDLYVELYEALESTEAILTGIVQGERGDLPLRSRLAMGGWVSNSPNAEIVEWFEFDFSEGVQSKRISSIGYEGYDMNLQNYGVEYIVTNLNKGLYPDVEASLNEDNLKLNKIVTNIDQSGDRVVVTLDDGDQYTANYVLMTFSVGVLQQGGVTFTPRLPEWKTEQIFNFQRGIIEFIFLKFSSKFWGDQEWALHASDRPQDVDRHYYPAFMNCEAEGMYPAGSNVLGAIVTGEEALRVEGLTDEEIKEEVLGVLRSMYGEENVSDLEDVYFKRWGSDPFHYGSFTIYPVPFDLNLDIHARLAAKVDRVYFAQQASSYNLGTHRGSMDASEQAMTKMLGCIKEDKCAEYEPAGMETEEDELYGCVKIPKKEGKSRKQIGAN